MDDKEIVQLSAQIKEIKVIVDDLAEIIDILHKELSDIKKNVVEINKIISAYDFDKDASQGYMHG